MPQLKISLINFLFIFIFILIVKSKSFKLKFLENNSLVQLNTSASDCKGVENFQGSHFMNSFSAVPSHSK